MRRWKDFWGSGFCCCRACHSEFGQLSTYLLHLDSAGYCRYGADWAVWDIGRKVMGGVRGRREKSS